jgi:serine/threonine protein kinase
MKKNPLFEKLKIIVFDKTIASGDEDKCFREYKKESILGKGAYGQVFSSKKDDRQVAIKVANIDSAKDFIGAKIGASIINGLQDEYWVDFNGNMQNLVPRFIDAWSCDDNGVLQVFTVLEKFDNNMGHLGKYQFNDIIATFFPDDEESKEEKKKEVKYLFTEEQIYDMFEIAKELDNIGIVHGDLNPTQFLYKLVNDEEKKEEVLKMVVSDFDLVDTFGWSSTTRNPGCPNPFLESNDTIVPNSLRGYFNQWQLSSWFKNVANAYIIKNSEIVEFGGVSGIPDEWEDELLRFCPHGQMNKKIQMGGPFFIKSVRGYTFPSDSIKKMNRKSLARYYSIFNEDDFNKILMNYLDPPIAF